ncbi:MAG TPA: helix-turn-helix transcriptional regulator [Dehalococcoidia bacterium]|nr:helix-turn-helix transcriptional regulator [Dehalococcoidia bacterium]
MLKVKQSTEMRIAEFNIPATMSKSEVARQLGVSRAYVTMLSQDKRKPSLAIQQKLTEAL